MDRRSFVRTMIGGIAASAAVRTWPFRIYSFPSNIVVPKQPSARQLKLHEAIGREQWAVLNNYLRFNRHFSGGELRLGPVERIALGDV